MRTLGDARRKASVETKKEESNSNDPNKAPTEEKTQADSFDEPVVIS